MLSFGVKRKAHKQALWKYILLVIGVLIFVLPIIIVSLYSVRPTGEFSTIPVWLNRATLEHYKVIFFEKPFLRYITNSIICATATAIIALILGAPAAYAFARFDFKGKQNILMWILSTRMVPPIVAALPIFIIFLNIGLFDNLIGLIIIYVAMNLALVIWILVPFFRQLPREFEEAALVDGCTWFSVIPKIVLPISIPGLISVIIITFIFSWNEFLIALFLTGAKSRTLPVAVTEFITPFGIQWGEMFASLVVIMVPVLIFIFAVQEYMVRGLVSLGGFKK